MGGDPSSPIRAPRPRRGRRGDGKGRRGHNQTVEFTAAGRVPQIGAGRGLAATVTRPVSLDHGWLETATLACCTCPWRDY